MQAHTQREFEASIKGGEERARNPETGGWVPAFRMPSRSSGPQEAPKYFVSTRSFSRKDMCDFEEESWSKHAVQFEGRGVPVIVCRCDPVQSMGKNNSAILHISTVVGDVHASASLPSKTRVRSLGYVGSFLTQYGSAAEVLKSPGCGDLVNRVAALRAPGEANGSTLVPFRADPRMDPRFPINATQRSTVENLRGGLDIIVGPPGKTSINELILLIGDLAIKMASTHRRSVHDDIQKHVRSVVDKSEFFSVFGAPSYLV